MNVIDLLIYLILVYLVRVQFLGTFFLRDVVRRSVITGKLLLWQLLFFKQMNYCVFFGDRSCDTQRMQYDLCGGMLWMYDAVVVFA